MQPCRVSSAFRWQKRISEVEVWSGRHPSEVRKWDKKCQRESQWRHCEQSSINDVIIQKPLNHFKSYLLSKSIKKCFHPNFIPKISKCQYCKSVSWILTEIPSVFLLPGIKDDQGDQNFWMIDWLLPWQLLHLALIIDLSWFLPLPISCDLIDFAAFSVSCRNLHDCTCRGCRGAGAGWAGLPGLRLWSGSARPRWQQWYVLQREGGQTGRWEVVRVVARHGADAHEHGCNEPQGRSHQTCTTSKRTPLFHHLRLCLKQKLFLWKKQKFGLPVSLLVKGSR